MGHTPYEIKWDEIIYSEIAPILIWSHVVISWFKPIFTVLKKYFTLAKEILNNQQRAGIGEYIRWLSGISQIQLS